MIDFSLAETPLISEPFPHIVFDGFIQDVGLLKQAAEDFELVRYWTRTKINKYQTSDLRKLTKSQRQVLNFLRSEKFVRFVSKLTGVLGLITDPNMIGAGLHFMSWKSFLPVHIDFNVKGKFCRKVNLLLYANQEWKEEDEGYLELWNETECVKKILPIFNRVVIFIASDKSWHGQPTPHVSLTDRKTFATYYYIPRTAEIKKRRTIWWPFRHEYWSEI